jgi:hypothetical protein
LRSCVVYAKTCSQRVVVTIADTGCPECNRRELALHVAKLDTERDALAIATLQERVKALEARNRDLDRRLERKGK